MGAGEVTEALIKITYTLKRKKIKTGYEKGQIGVRDSVKALSPKSEMAERQGEGCINEIRIKCQIKTHLICIFYKIEQFYRHILPYMMHITIKSFELCKQGAKCCKEIYFERHKVLTLSSIGN